MSEEFKIPQSGILYFTATWCAPCKQIKPFIEELQKERNDIYKIDIEENQLMAQYFQVTNIPSFVSIKNGKEYERRVGVLPKKEIVSMLERAEQED